MEKKLFYAYLNDEKQLNDESLHQLKLITEMYPYFQTAKLLFLKNMKDVGHPDYTSELKKVAITCCDRRKLFYYLNDDRYARFFPKMSAEKASINDRTDVLLDSFLESLHKDDDTEHNENSEKDNEWGGDTIISTDYFAYLEQTGQEDKPYDDEGDSKPMQHQELVDNFLQKSSSDEGLFSSKNREMGNSQESSQGIDNLLDNDAFLTETLAQVYIKQRKYEQALTIIKRLSLNFPKKSTYFADQIRFLEYLIYNEKNKK